MLRLFEKKPWPLEIEIGTIGMMFVVAGLSLFLRLYAPQSNTISMPIPQPVQPVQTELDTDFMRSVG